MYAFITPQWTEQAKLAVKENDAEQALTLLGQLVDPNRRSALALLHIWQPIMCKDCEHYTKDPDPLDPGWPMCCDETGRDMLEPYGCCWWATPKETPSPADI